MSDIEDKPKSAPEQLKKLWDELPRRRRIILVAAVLLTFGIVGYVATREVEPPYAAVASGVSHEEAARIVKELQALGVPYRLRASSTIVEVPESRVDDVRLALTDVGALRGPGTGFEIFDQQSWSTSSRVEEINLRRALQGELERTIGGFAGIESARVHIAPGRRSVFREADEPPSASVNLVLRHGASKVDVRGIVATVARAVDGLDPERVVVTDETGRILSSGDPDDAITDMQTRLEQTLRKRISDMLERAVGPENIEVVVTAEIDQSQVDQTEELFDPQGAVIRTEIRNLEGATNDGTIGGIAGARGNLPGTDNAPQAGAAGSDADRLSERRDFEISKVVRRTAGPKAKIKRLHVAILVDHRVVPAVEDGAEPTTEPRGTQELATLAALARNAAGLDDERGDTIEIQTVRFHRPELPAVAAATPPVGLPLPLPLPILAAIAGGALLLVGLTGFLLVRRRKAKRRGGQRGEVLPLPASIDAVERALDSDEQLTPHERLAQLAGGKEALGLPGATLHERVGEAVKTDTEQAARVLAAWLTEGGEKA